MMVFFGSKPSLQLQFSCDPKCPTPSTKLLLLQFILLCQYTTQRRLARILFARQEPDFKGASKHSKLMQITSILSTILIYVMLCDTVGMSVS